VRKMASRANFEAFVKTASGWLSHSVGSDHFVQPRVDYPAPPAIAGFAVGGKEV
jgi:hypothetical protein